MLNPRTDKLSWLGAEAIPSGLREINGTRQAWANRRGSGGLTAPRARATGWAAIATRWLRSTSRPY